MDSFEHAYSPKETEVALTAEQEAAEKIYDFLWDPKLKMHISDPRNLRGIIEKGILSQEFANEIQHRMQTTFDLSECGGEADRYISISDREKNPKESTHHANELWLKNFIMDGSYGLNPSFAILLSPDLAVVDEKKRDIKTRRTVFNESLVDVRIRPNKFEGIILIDHDALYETIQTSGMTTGFRLKKTDPIVEYYQMFFGDTDQDGRIIDVPIDVAKQKLETFFQKPVEEIVIIDVFIHYAKQLRIPLYTIDPSDTETYVVWPEIDDNEDVDE